MLCSSVHGAGLNGAHNPADIADAAGLEIEGFAMAGSTFRSLRDATDDRWNQLSVRDGNNAEMLFARAGIGYASQSWEVRIGSRLEILGQANRETLEVYRAQVTGAPLAVGSRFPVRYSVAGFEAQGLSAGKSFSRDVDGHVLRLGISTTLMEAKRVKLQQGAGQALVQNNGSLLLTGATQNDDSSLDTAANNFIPRFRDQTPSGWGYSVDLGLHYVSPQGMELEWMVADAFSAIEWKKVPEITLSGSSTFNGQFPIGRKVLVDLAQTLAPKHTLTARVPWRDYSLQLGSHVMEGFTMFNAGLSKKVSDEWTLACDYDFYFQSLGVTVSHPRFEFSLQTDNANLQAARALSLRFAVHAAF